MKVKSSNLFNMEIFNDGDGSEYDEIMVQSKAQDVEFSREGMTGKWDG